MTTFNQMTISELITEFNIGKNAAEALGNYLMWLGWGESIKAATEAASDFIETEQDIDEFATALQQIKQTTE